MLLGNTKPTATLAKSYKDIARSTVGHKELEKSISGWCFLLGRRVDALGLVRNGVIEALHIQHPLVNSPTAKRDDPFAPHTTPVSSSKQ